MINSIRGKAPTASHVKVLSDVFDYPSLMKMYGWFSSISENEWMVKRYRPELTTLKTFKVIVNTSAGTQEWGEV